MLAKIDQRGVIKAIPRIVLSIILTFSILWAMQYISLELELYITTNEITYKYLFQYFLQFVTLVLAIFFLWGWEEKTLNFRGCLDAVFYVFLSIAVCMPLEPYVESFVSLFFSSESIIFSLFMAFFAISCFGLLMGWIKTFFENDYTSPFGVINHIPSVISFLLVVIFILSISIYLLGLLYPSMISSEIMESRVIYFWVWITTNAFELAERFL
jgi:hypothetical protein